MSRLAVATRATSESWRSPEPQAPAEAARSAAGLPPVTEPECREFVPGYALPQSPLSPGLARTVLREALAGFPEETLAVAEMLVSELVTNAVQHARSFLVLHIDRTWPGVTVLVEDASAAPPQLHPDSVDAESGRGLVLVDTLAESWGWKTTSTGKIVWFVL